MGSRSAAQRAQAAVIERAARSAREFDRPESGRSVGEDLKLAPRQRFGLAMTEAVLAIRRRQCIVHRHQVKQGGTGIHQRIHQ